ncbi:MAG: tetratricopeptide repeat protein [Hyphomonas sp.]|uniref:tetratricopeptide repeat protein n=1 Tax=Hyphomonas sp. TaxID=87 RepID=UPI003529343B
MDETPAPATLADQAADVWGGVYSSVESVWTWFESIGLVNQLGVVAAVLAILGAVWWIIRLPFRRAQQRREAAEKARQLEEAKAEAEQARQDREALRRQMEDNRRASDDKLGRLETLIADFIARERAEAAAEGRAMDEETVERVEQAALGLGELAPAATERVLTGDESGFDELEALAQQKTSAARQAEAEAADKSRAAARIWIEIGDLAYLNHTHRALAAYRAARDLDAGNTYAWNRAGLLDVRLGNLDDARQAFQHVLDTAGASDKTVEAAALGNLGLIAMTRGDLDAAEDFYTRALALDEALGNKEGMATNLGNLGLIARTRGNLDAAEDFHTRALALDEALGRKEGMANQLGNLGLIGITRGKLDVAEDFHTRSLTLQEAIGSKEGMAIQLGNLGVIANSRGDLDAAEDFNSRALVLHEAIGRKEGMAIQLGNLGNTAMARGNLDAAEDFYTRALVLTEALGSKEGMATLLANLGALAKQRGDTISACTHWARSVDLFQQIGMPQMVEQISGWMRAAGCPGIDDES